jgi:RNA polymerase sigma-70 factor (ECF subfamily)
VVIEAIMLSSNAGNMADQLPSSGHAAGDGVINLNMIQNAQAYLERQSSGQAASAQQASSWEQFYRLASELIQRFAQSCGVGESDLDDCLQDVWVELIKALRSFRYDPERARFPTWLFTLVRSKAIDLIRKKCKRSSESLSGQEDTLLGRDDADPADHCELKDQLEAVRDLVGDLYHHVSPQSYDVLMLRSIKDLEIAEVAEVLELTPAQVRLHHHRAKLKLHHLYTRRHRGRKKRLSLSDHSGRELTTTGAGYTTL